MFALFENSSEGHNEKKELKSQDIRVYRDIQDAHSDMNDHQGPCEKMADPKFYLNGPECHVIDKCHALIIGSFGSPIVSLFGSFWGIGLVILFVMILIVFIVIHTQKKDQDTTTLGFDGKTTRGGGGI